MEKIVVLILVLFLSSVICVDIVESINETNSSKSDQAINQSQFEEIGEGMYYNIKSSIFQWFSRIVETIKSIFTENVKIYEEESKKYSEYYKQRNDNIKKSYVSKTEPPFNPKICPETTPIDKNTKWNFCSCGDGVCASYEDKCNCEKDCGSCPNGTICKRGECIDIVNNTCMNKICEEGENETCPWDCNVYMIEEVEEIIKGNKTDKKTNIITMPEKVS